MPWAYYNEEGFCFNFGDTPPEGVENPVKLPEGFCVDGARSYAIVDGELQMSEPAIPEPPEASTEQKLQAALERQEFLEDCLAELINEVYSE